MTGYRIPRKELVMDALNRGLVFVLILGSVITGATSHQPKAFTMLYIFVRPPNLTPMDGIQLVCFADFFC